MSLRIRRAQAFGGLYGPDRRSSSGSQSAAGAAVDMAALTAMAVRRRMQGDAGTQCTTMRAVWCGGHWRLCSKPWPNRMQTQPCTIAGIADEQWLVAARHRPAMPRKRASRDMCGDESPPAAPPPQFTTVRLSEAAFAQQAQRDTLRHVAALQHGLDAAARARLAAVHPFLRAEREVMLGDVRVCLRQEWARTSLSTGHVCWDSGHALACYLLEHWPAGVRRVLELGCGCAPLPSMAAALQGAGHVRATDVAAVLELANENVQRNLPPSAAAVVHVEALDWAHDGEVAASSKPDLVVASDTVYDTRLHAPFMRVLLAAVGRSVPALLGFRMRGEHAEEEFVALAGAHFSLRWVPPSHLPESYRDTNVRLLWLLPARQARARSARHTLMAM